MHLQWKSTVWGSLMHNNCFFWRQVVFYDSFSFSILGKNPNFCGNVKQSNTSSIEPQHFSHIFQNKTCSDLITRQRKSDHTHPVLSVVEYSGVQPVPQSYLSHTL